ncbi:hypothetical protein [Planctomicrobium piriforme]|uniref:Uncharacterized protein n=1 Tax=Planctomicrobium piriforme TaxID=1576369 RepID=A0A1I3DIC9_9PLAN|nr:hypothetical protein [Planctomicrobium piriforme]SFH86504.1 hypothetical protein SAMN05421753_103257 [Planctomicrobium piriforme]
MNGFRFGFILAVVLLPSSVGLADSESEALAILKRWGEQSPDVTSIRCMVSWIRYDKMFERFSVGVGEIGYLDPEHGYFRLDPPDPAQESGPIKDEIRKDRINYHRGEPTQTHIRQVGAHLRSIYEADQTYFDHEMNSNQQGWLSQLITNSLSIQPLFLFLPALPQLHQSSQWTFKFEKQEGSKIFIDAYPVNGSELVRHMRVCKLCFNDDPLELHAVKFIDNSGSMETVLVFTDIEKNPAPWYEPDVSCYTCLSCNHTVDAEAQSDLVTEMTEQHGTTGEFLSWLSLFFVVLF